MPGAPFHANYWANANPSPVVAPQFVSYPLWQTSIITGSGFGAMQVVWTWFVQKVSK